MYHVNDKDRQRLVFPFYTSRAKPAEQFRSERESINEKRAFRWERPYQILVLFCSPRRASLSDVGDGKSIRTRLQEQEELPKQALAQLRRKPERQRLACC